MNDSTSSEVIRFGPFEFDAAAFELRRRGVTVRIQGQPLRVLALLLERPGSLVTRETIRQELWPEGTFVDFEHGLNAAVRRLRRTLEDGARAPRFIETLPRRGYRFVGAIDAAANGHRSNGPRSAGRTIAVLPFDNATGDDDCEYLVDGITERLINGLALIHDLRVIARSAVFRHKGSRQDPRVIGRRLGVNAVVVGAVSRHPTTALSIHAELVDVAHGFQLWGRSYERRPEDLAGLEQQLVGDVQAALQVHPSTAELRRLRKPGTTNAAAHLEYLKGRYFLNQMNEAGIRRAIDHFAGAIAADGRYGLAYCGLADCYSLCAFLGLEAPDLVLPEARAAARSALRLDHELAEAHASLASITKVYEWNWQRAELGYRRALALNPSYAAAHRSYAAHLAAMGRHDESRSAIQRASDLDPVSPIVGTEAAWYAYMAREFDRARSHATDALGLQPEFAPALYTLGLAHEQAGSRHEALEAFRAAAAQSPNPAVIASEAHLLAAMGRRDEALQLGAQLERSSRERYVAPYWFAIIASGLNAPDIGLTWLERAVEQHDVWLVWLKTEPRLDPLRAHDRFQRILDRVGLGHTNIRHDAAGSELPARAAGAADTAVYP